MDPVYGSFFRYRSFPGSKGATWIERWKQKRRIKKMFKDRIHWFANPSTLNDPFDCQPVLLWSDDEAENRARIEETYVEGFEKIHGFRPNVEDIQPNVDEIMQVMSTQEARNQALSDAVAKRTAVLCLSRRWDIAQQWTYYAGEHTGFCIEFLIEEETPLSAFEVGYVENRATVDIHQLYGDAEARNSMIAPCLLTKATAWQHEEEVRLLTHRHGNKEMPKGVIKSVTFGIYASDKHVDWLRKICRKADLELGFYRCVMDDRHFTLDRKPL